MRKPLNGKLISCQNCCKEFYVPAYRISKAKYCSRTCLALDARHQIIAKCEICEKEFSHISCRANRAKYCSRTCYHKAQHVKGTVEYTCRHCSKKFLNPPSTKRIYCSKACVNKGVKEQWNPGFGTVRKALKIRGKIKECQLCGYNEFPDILGVHNKDGDRKNNGLENLMVLCANCHSLLHRKHICH